MLFDIALYKKDIQTFRLEYAQIVESDTPYSIFEESDRVMRVLEG